MLHTRVPVYTLYKAVQKNPNKAFVGTGKANWEAGGEKGKKKKKLSGAMHLFKSISICVHIFITSVIIKSGNHR